MSNLKENIVKTLAYSDIFEFPLTLSEIYKFYNGEKPVTKKEIASTLMSMGGLVESTGKYFYLHGRKKNVIKRQMREIESEIKLQKAKNAINTLSKIPTIQLIAISGSLSQKNAGLDDDIDLFIITRKDTVWITRLLVNIILIGIGEKRKKSVIKAKDKICPNMIVSGKSLEIPEGARNLYTAREITQLKIEYEKNRAGKELFANNKWIKKIFPNTNIEDVHRKNHESGLIESCINIVDNVLFVAQRIYMGKITNEKIEKNIAKFHPRKTSKEVMYVYKKRKNNLLKHHKFLGERGDNKNTHTYN